MLAKYAIAGLAGSALLASVAFAQSPSATTDSANTDKATTAAPCVRHRVVQGQLAYIEDGWFECVQRQQRKPGIDQ